MDAEGADPCCFGIEQSIFAAPHTLNFRLLSAIVKRRAALAGLDGDFSAHSLRSGFMTEAGRQNVPLAEASWHR
jgi:hypothetical protein